jgi:predicted aspartyl protease
MARYFFPPGSTKIEVSAVVRAQRSRRIVVAVDTAATTTQISTAVAKFIGLDLTNPVRYTDVVTASRVERAPVVCLPSLTTLGKTATDLDIVVRALPPQAGLDGLLGLNFFVKYTLFVNYSRGILVIQDRRSKNFWHRLQQAIEIWKSME